ncbi:MAG TPA: SGNH/GDSL hydrolase family protein, partial [Thermoguttaceae bacterium]|nr:SGNH/GDSL hydrolase family protein [Thermoguttaceae bacterium]
PASLLVSVQMMLLSVVVLAPCSERATAAEISKNVHDRGSLMNSRVQFEQNKKGHVAFIGGSITEMNGYRPMVCEILERRFPNTEFTFTDAGISSTCSTTGAFRLEEDVLSKGPVDLFFIEFAVNDNQDAAHARRECIRGMEGILRHARAHNPNMDIVITYFTNPEMVETIQNGGEPLSSGSHETVAKHYNISTIDLASEVAQRITAGTLTWKQFGGTHPAPAGNAICAGMIDDLMSVAWKEPLASDAEKVAYQMPEKPLDPGHYGQGRFVDPAAAKIGHGWKLHVPAWKDLPGGFRDRFDAIPLLCTTEPDAELTLEFTGKAIGAYILAGPDAGIVEASIDDGPFVPHDLFHRYSSGLHYPRTVVFNADLAPGKHVLRLRMTDRSNEGSSGTAMRILEFTAN